MPELDDKYAGQQNDSWRQPVQAGPLRSGAHRNPDPRRDQVLARCLHNIPQTLPPPLLARVVILSLQRLQCSQEPRTIQEESAARLVPSKLMH